MSNITMRLQLPFNGHAAVTAVAVAVSVSVSVTANGKNQQQSNRFYFKCQFQQITTRTTSKSKIDCMNMSIDYL